MATKSPITGDEIKSRPLSREGRDNWDKAFAKKSAHEWLKGEVVEIVDPDGWRRDDGVTMDTPITYKDFCARIVRCTVNYKGDFK